MEKKAASGIILALLLIGVTLTFNIHPAMASGAIYIGPDGSINPPTVPIQRDGDVYTFTDFIYDEIVVARSDIVIDGNGYGLQGTGAWYSFGIVLSTINNVTIKNTRISAFTYGINLQSSNNNTINGNNITANIDLGVYLYSSSGNNISGNNILANNAGIWLSSSSENNISGNEIANNGNGISLSSSNDNSISENDITANNWNGISLGYYSSGNSVSGNNITANNERGIYLNYADGNSINGNNITANNWTGILLNPSSHNNISENDVAANGAGIALGWLSSDNSIFGNRIKANSQSGISLYAASNNVVYHNNFENNAEQVNIWEAGPVNLWDDGYPSGGNYWRDYAGVDANSDGIGDSPYFIDESNQDRYPLTNPWSSAERKVGVEIGSWVRYSNFDIEWSSNDPDATMPIGLSILREVEWWENSIEDILDTKIRYQQLLHFEDGSEYPTTCWIDVDTGSGTPLSFVSSGLVPDDCIYTSAPWYAWKINETISHTCAGVNRETNHLNLTASMTLGPPPAYPNTTGNFYWDRETGVLSELFMKHLNLTGSYVTSWSVFYEIVDTNLWEAPTPPTIMASLDIDPDTLNLRSKGKWITAYIQLPEGYDPADIDASTILLNGTISPVLDPKYGFVTNSSEYLVDHNGDGVLERMVKFNKTEVASWISSDLGIHHGNVTLTITGKLLDETPFEATDILKLLFPGDVDDDADVDFNDFIIFSGCYGLTIENPSCIPRADFNEDGTIDFNDLIILAGNYGKTA